MFQILYKGETYSMIARDEWFLKKREENLESRIQRNEKSTKDKKILTTFYKKRMASGETDSVFTCIDKYCPALLLKAFATDSSTLLFFQDKHWKFCQAPDFYLIVKNELNW